MWGAVQRCLQRQVSTSWRQTMTPGLKRAMQDKPDSVLKKCLMVPNNIAALALLVPQGTGMQLGAAI